MFVDDDQGAEGGYEKRTSVSFLLTPSEAHDLRVALADLLAREGESADGWHAHVEAWDWTTEIVLLPDETGTRLEPTPEEHLDRWLTERAAEGSSVMRAVRAVASRPLPPKRLSGRRGCG